MIKLYEFLSKQEYHKEDKLIFVKFDDVDELFKIIGQKWIKDGLECHISSGNIIFNIEELIDEINSDWTEEIIENLDKEK